MVDGLDPRSVANLVLREAWARGQEVSNLKLQKLLFLCHAFFVVENGKCLVRGNFLAWQFGPVHQEAYDAFKHFGAAPITSEAMRINPVSGEKTRIVMSTDQNVVDLVRKIVQFYGPWSAADLVNLTHAKNGPWDHVVSRAADNANMGLRISDEVIVRCFKYHWFGAKESKTDEEPDDDRPLLA